MTVQPDRSSPPIAFISHAGEDKKDFAEPLSKELAQLGIQPWLDRWEIHPGDSLVQRLFDEGLATADAVIVIASVNSVSKKWVREELDQATVRRIEQGTRIIPVRLDGVDLPHSLKHLAWIEGSRYQRNYRDTAQRIADTLLGVSHRPQVVPVGDQRERARVGVESPAEALDISNVHPDQSVFYLHRQNRRKPDEPSSEIRRVMTYFLRNLGSSTLAISDIEVRYPVQLTDEGGEVRLLRTQANDSMMTYPSIHAFRSEQLAMLNDPSLESKEVIEPLPVLLGPGDQRFVLYRQSFELRFDDQAFLFPNDEALSRVLLSFFGLKQLWETGPFGTYRRPFLTRITTSQGLITRQLDYLLSFVGSRFYTPSKEVLNEWVMEARHNSDGPKSLRWPEK